MMSFGTLKSYATIDGDKNLVTDGGLGAPCACIVVGTAGDLVLTPASGGVDQTVTFAAGVPQCIAATAIKQAGSTAGKVTVAW